MSTKFISIFSFIAFVGFIYLLRENETSPQNFLQNHIPRLLQLQVQPGSISSLLCGSTQVTPVSNSERNRATTISQQIKNLRSDNKLIEFIQGPDPNTQFGSDYAKPLLAYAAPWIVLFAISLIGCIGYTTSWACMHCTSCRLCGLCDKPKSNKHQKRWKIATFVFMIPLVATAIAGMVFSREIYSGGKQTICALGLLADKLIEGSTTPSDRWIGLNDMINKMQTTFANFDPATYIYLSSQYTSATTTTDTASINSVYTPASSSVTTFYNNNNARTVTRADPSIGGTYQPSYIQNISAVKNDFQNELDLKKNNVTDASQNISSTLPILGGGSIFTTAIQFEIDGKLQNATYSSNNMTKKVKKFGSLGNSGVSGVSGALFGIYALDVILGTASVLSIILVWKGYKSWKGTINITWWFVSFMTILSLVLATILFPASIALVEVCETAYKISVDPIFYNQTFDKFLNNPNFTNARKVLYSCFFQDGEVLTALGLEQYFEPFYPLFDALDSTVLLTGTSSYTVPDSWLLPAQQSLVGKLQNGLLSDSSKTTTDLNKLNSLTDSNSCTNVRDTWALNSGVCPSSSGVVFTPSNAANYNLNSQTCIGFDVWGTNHDITQRYTATTFPQPGCGQVAGSNADVGLDNFVNNFETSRQSVSSLFSNVQSDLSNFQSANHNFMSAITTATSNMDVVRNGVDPVYQSLGNHNSGIIYNSNCKWVVNSYNLFQEEMCIRLVPGIYQTAVVIIIASVFGLIGTFVLFWVARKSLAQLPSSKSAVKDSI